MIEGVSAPAGLRMFNDFNQAGLWCLDFLTGCKNWKDPSSSDKQREIKDVGLAGEEQYQSVQVRNARRTFAGHKCANSEIVAIICILTFSLLAVHHPSKAE